MIRLLYLVPGILLGTFVAVMYMVLLGNEFTADQISAAVVIGMVGIASFVVTNIILMESK